MPLQLVPQELRQFAQWVAWKFEQTNGGKPTKIPYDIKTGYRASVINPSTWCSFDEAVAALNSGANYNGLGFVLTRNDPFSFIDLDNPDNNPEIMQSHNFIYQQFSNTYAELSPSGTGVHIIGKGAVPTACKRHKVEIYDCERYMTVTGDVINNAPISDVQALLWQLYEDMGGRANAKIADIPEQPQLLPDDVIWANAATAENGALFRKLWAGDWSDYSSGSEGDMALMDFLQFHSGNIDQMVRMFRASPAGQRVKDGKVKAHRDDYVMNMVAKSFDRANMTTLAPAQHIVEKQQAEIRSWKNEQQETEQQQERPFVDLLPGGLVADIATYIYNAAPYPLPEAAILAAVAMVSGIAGRTYNVSHDVGLNQYLMLVATSGAGKEGMKDGIMRLFNRLGEKGHGFAGPGTLPSAQGLNRRFTETPQLSMVSVLPEFGPFMRSLTYSRPGSSDDALKGFLLKLYTANGRGKVLGDAAYSDKSKNMSTLQSPSYTILTEAEPEGFYKSFDREMIASGLIPRFTIIEYNGMLPTFNKNRQLEPSPFLVSNIGVLCDIVRQLATNHTVIDVTEDNEAAELLEQFREWSRAQAASADYELRPLWNRAHMRVWKLAGVVALRDFHKPVITKPDVEFAIAVERQYINNLLHRLETGTIGDPVSEVRQEQFVYEVLADYIVNEYDNLGVSHKKRIKPEVKRDNLIPRYYLQQRTNNAAPFRKGSHNYSKAGDDALSLVIKKMIEAGDLSKPLNETVTENVYGTRQVLYKVNNVSAILDRVKRG